MCTSLNPSSFIGPAWLDEQFFDILATVPPGAPKEQIPLMFQALLEERFKLAFHRDTQMLPMYALVVRSGGPILKEALPDDGDPPKESYKRTGTGEKRVTSGAGAGAFGRFTMRQTADGMGHSEFASMTMRDLAEFLSQLHGRVGLPVVDKTGLKGSYQVVMDIDWRNTTPIQGDADRPPAASDPPVNSISASLQKMGLVLVRQRAPAEKLIIDRIERTPAPN